MLVHAGTDQKTPAGRFPLILRKSTHGIHPLVQIAAAPPHVVLQAVLVIFGTSSQRSWHKQAAVEVIVVLRTCHPGHVGGVAIRFQFFLQVLASAVVTVAVDVLCRGINAQALFFIGRKQVELYPSGIDAVLQLLGYQRLVRRESQLVATTTVLLQVVILYRNLRIIAGLDVGAHAHRLTFQLRQLGKSVAVVVIAGTFSVLSENCQSQLLVVGYQRSIHCGIVFENRCIAYPRQCVRELGRVAHRFLGNDVDGAGNGRRAKQSRAAAAHHLHTFNHVGRNLLQTVYPRQRAEDGTRVDENLRIRPVQSVDAHLLISAVLAVVLHTHTRLEVQPLRQTGRVGILERLDRYHVYQRRRHAAGRLVTVGRNHHPLECHVVLANLEIQFQRLALGELHGAALCLIAYRTDFNSKSPFGQVFQEVMPCFVGSRPDGCPLQHNRYISQVFLGIFIGYVANDIGIGIVQFVCKSIAREQCQYCSQKVYIKSFHL